MTFDEAITQSLTSPHGLSLTLPDEQAAIRFRAHFCALRERRQRLGDTSWDDVAVSIPLAPAPKSASSKNPAHRAFKSPSPRDHSRNNPHAF